MENVLTFTEERKFTNNYKESNRRQRSEMMAEAQEAFKKATGDESDYWAAVILTFADVEDLESEEIPEEIADHSQFTETDYRYFRSKGYAHREIKAKWDMEAGLGYEPTVHDQPFDIVGYLNQ